MLIPFRENWHDFPCKLWTGSVAHGGYGQKWFKGGVVRVHRQAWIDAYGPLSTDSKVMHACDTPSCYALEHLGLGTQQDNIDDMYSKGREHKGGTNKTGGAGKHYNNKLTIDQVIDIKSMLALPTGEKPTQEEIGDMYGVGKCCIKDIKSGKTWNNINIGCEF